MSSLFKSSVIGDWKAAYAKRKQYVAFKEKKAIESLKRGKRKNKEELIANMKLVEFDQYLFNELRDTITNRKGDDHMTLDELSTVMKWKLLRGQFRPRLQKLIDGNKNKEVIECTKNAFKIIHNAINKETNNIDDIEQLKLSIKELDKLKGVGVATASLILSIYTKIIPFMADESLMAISPGVKLKYDKKTYMQYVNKLIGKCEDLREKVDQNKIDDEAKDLENDDEVKDDVFIVTPFVLGECLWTDCMNGKYGDIENDEDVDAENKSIAINTNKKRKAEKDNDGPPPAKKRKI